MVQCSWLVAAVALCSTTTFVTAHAGHDHSEHANVARSPAVEQANADALAELRKRYPGVNAHVVGGIEAFEHVAKLREREITGEGLERRQATAATATRIATSRTAGANTANSAIGAAIGSTTTVGPTVALPTTFAAGTRPSAIPNAPPLPAVAIVPANYPTLDRVPPTDSALVQKWLTQVDMSKVPNIPVTQLGGCQNASNAAAVQSAATNCWWTCGGCTRATDVTVCPTTLQWGLSYDDGPSPDTPRLLNFLDTQTPPIKSTFFVVGSRVISRPDMIQYEYMSGHQLAVHTWSHTALTTQTNEQIVAELGWSKYALQQVTGVTPNQMRPPYGDIDDRVRAIALQMGLTPVIWTASNGRTFDTQDWQIGAGVVTAATVITNFESILGTAPQLRTGFIVLEHDLYQQAVTLATQFVLPAALAQTPQLSLQPIISCLGKTVADAYIETSSNQSITGGSTATGLVPLVSAVATGAALTQSFSVTGTAGTAGGAGASATPTKAGSAARSQLELALAGLSVVAMAVATVL